MLVIIEEHVLSRDAFSLMWPAGHEASGSADATPIYLIVAAPDEPYREEANAFAAMNLFMPTSWQNIEIEGVEYQPICAQCRLTLRFYRSPVICMMFCFLGHDFTGIECASTS